MGHRVGLDGCGKSRPLRDSIPGPHSARSTYRKAPRYVAFSNHHPASPHYLVPFRPKYLPKHPVLTFVKYVVRTCIRCISQISVCLFNLSFIKLNYYIDICLIHRIHVRNTYMTKMRIYLMFIGPCVVKALCYKSEGRWFDPSWCQFIFH